MGKHSTMVSIIASGPSCPGFETRSSQNYLGEKKLMLLKIQLTMEADWQRVVKHLSYQKHRSTMQSDTDPGISMIISISETKCLLHSYVCVTTQWEIVKY